MTILSVFDRYFSYYMWLRVRHFGWTEISSLLGRQRYKAKLWLSPRPIGKSAFDRKRLEQRWMAIAYLAPHYGEEERPIQHSLTVTPRTVHSTPLPRSLSTLFTCSFLSQGSTGTTSPRVRVRPSVRLPARCPPPSLAPSLLTQFLPAMLHQRFLLRRPAAPGGWDKETSCARLCAVQNR